MTPHWLNGLLPVMSAFLGLAAGLLSPLVSGGIGRRSTRRADQRACCEEILEMFRNVNVVETLRSPLDATRRSLLLIAVRIRDATARNACMALVEYASGPQATEAGILDRWVAMIEEVARVYRTAG